MSTDLTISVDEELIATARELGPLIRKHADEAERNRRPSKVVMDALHDAGLQRMYVPKSLGGLEVDPVTYARVAEEIAGYDSAAGWALQVGNSLAWWAARLPDKGVEEIYADGPNALIAGAFHPPQPTIETDDGYRVTGRAPLASNINDAQWVFLTGLVMDGDKPKSVYGMPEVVQLIFPADEVKIIKTWDSLGMRGTDSQDITFEDVFVLKSRTFPIIPEFEPGTHYRGSLYRFPAIGQLATIFTPVILAVGRGAIDEFRDMAMDKTPFGFTKSLKERTIVQTSLARAEAILRSARLFFYDTINRIWEQTIDGQPATLEQKADLMLTGSHAAESVKKVTDMMHGLAGTTGIYATNRLERHFRDAHTLKQHGFLSANRYETVGQVYLGLQPEFVMVYF